MDSLYYPETTIWAAATGGRVTGTQPRMTGSVAPRDHVPHRDLMTAGRLLAEYLIDCMALTGSAVGWLNYGVSDHAPLELERTSEQDLKRIQEVFKPAMTELATLFGVSRQTLYNWRNGEQPRADLISKLAELARCADLVAAGGLKDTSRILTRKAIGGRSLFDVVKAGEPAAGFTDQMVQLLRLEQEGRDELNARFRGRARRNDPTDFQSPSNE